MSSQWPVDPRYLCVMEAGVEEAPMLAVLEWLTEDDHDRVETEAKGEGQ